jgi:hypothetical protein
MRFVMPTIYSVFLRSVMSAPVVSDTQTNGRQAQFSVPSLIALVKHTVGASFLVITQIWAKRKWGVG